MHTQRRACLLFHGFSGGPFEIEPLASYLQKNGWLCNMPILPGHGDELNQRIQVHYTDWVNAADKEAEKMVRKFGSFDLVGFSMGGLLSVYLANRYPVRRLVLLNAAVIYVSPYRFFQVTLEQVKQKDWSRFKKMGLTPWYNTWQFIQLVNKLKPEIKKLRVPSFIIQGERDPIIHPNSAYYIHRNVPGTYKKLQFFPKSKHLICLDVEADEVFHSIHQFLTL